MSFSDRHAQHYDAIYSWKDYDAEAARLVALLAEEGLPGDARVLEAACGTGAWLRALMPHYQVEGFDLSPKMVQAARRSLPGVRVWVGDMRSFSVDEPFDVTLCMFSSIGYIGPEPELVGALRAFAAATRPGGWVVVEPWLTPEAFEPGRVHAVQHREEGLAISRHAATRLDGARSLLDFRFVVTTPEGHEVFEETHALWLYEVAQMRRALEAAGLVPRWLPEGLTGRGLWIARRPAVG